MGLNYLFNNAPRPSELIYIWFYNQVRNRGPWDFKQDKPQYENFGNFHFGAVGEAAGIPEGIISRGAGATRKLTGASAPDFSKYLKPDSYGDDPIDQTWIKAGIDYARRSGF